VAGACDVVEIGVPFTDPMADGTTIQRASFVALADGVTLPWILGELKSLELRHAAPILLMSYLNPLLAYGLERLPQDAAAAGVAGFIVPDLPFEESGEIKAALEPRRTCADSNGHARDARGTARDALRAAEGFIYAVTMTGTTGKSVAVPDEVLAYMDRVKAVAKIPVCAGFGIRSRDQITRLGAHVDGVVIGSALVESLERGDDVAAFLTSLR
jgi:tryptophan synthase alpha chain